MDTKTLDALMAQAAPARLHRSSEKELAELQAQFRLNVLMGKHGPALVAALKANLEVLKGCEFAMQTFLPDSRFVAQEGLNQIQPAINSVEALLTKLDQEAKG